MATSGNLPGIAFVGCDISAGAAAGAGGGSAQGSAGAHAHGRREVVVNGKRVKTVDVHAHCIVPDAAKVINHPLEAPGLLWSNVGDRLAQMDQTGVDVEALSINPFWYRAERDAAAELIRIQNEALVEFCASQPERFVAFATAALQYPDLAAEQVEHAVKRLGFRGVGVAGSVAGEDLANPKFHPFWAKCEELGVLVFMHPLGTRELEPSGRLGGNGLLTNTIGNPLETTIALSHLIFEGTLDRFPGLKICAAHGGGFLPSYANRSDAVITTFPNRVGPLPKKKPTEYIRGGQLYFDSIMFTGEGMRHLIAEAGIDHVVLGTDYPFPWNTVPVDHIMAIPGLSDADRIKILGGTACQLLGIKT
jgi:aminocarboxymuconate-semialdehyde decarboxylase